MIHKVTSQRSVTNVGSIHRLGSLSRSPPPSRGYLDSSLQARAESKSKDISTKSPVAQQFNVPIISRLNYQA